MARLASILVIVAVLVSACAVNTASVSGPRDEAARAQGRPPEAGGGGY